MFNWSIFKKKKNEEQINDVSPISKIDDALESSSKLNNITEEVIENVIVTDNSPQKEQYDKKTPKYTKMPNTVYNAVVKIRKEDFSRKDLRKISVIIKAKYHKIYGTTDEPEKITQKEGNTTYEVYYYPETMRKEILKIVNWFYKIKENAATKHRNFQRSQTLAKLKKIGSPDYETQLVKFNMEEDERLKQEKNRSKPQFQQKNNQNWNSSYNNRNNVNRTKTFNKENGNRPSYNRNTNRSANNVLTKPNFSKRKFTSNGDKRI
jgi:hypothetical protein